MKIKTFNSEDFGYTQITTFFTDFSIADNYGIDAIKDTYKRCLDYARSNYKVLTEFVMVLNWKLWQHWEEKNNNFARLYNDLWEKERHYAETHLKGKELDYYYITTD